MVILQSSETILLFARVVVFSPENESTIFEQGCQMVRFQTKNPNLGKFWRFFEW
jgi:hypothetical protein